MMLKPKILVALSGDKLYSQLTDVLSAKGFIVMKSETDSISIEVNTFHFRPDVVIFNSSLIDFKFAKALVKDLKLVNNVPLVINMFAYEERSTIDLLENMGVLRSFCAPFDYNAIADDVESFCNSIPIDLDVCCSEIQSKISELLRMFTFNNSRHGYNYVKDAIFMLACDKNLKPVFSRDIYPALSKKYGASAMSVERSMRVSINSAWNRTDDSVKQLFFNIYSLKNKIKPSNNEFTITLAEYIKGEFSDYIELIKNSEKNKMD